MYTALTLLKIDLGITTDAYDARLDAILDGANKMIKREGVTLDLADPEDIQLLVMYAAWLWRRRDSGEGMPRMVRFALNNRLFGAKMEA